MTRFKDENRSDTKQFVSPAPRELSSTHTALQQGASGSSDGEGAVTVTPRGLTTGQSLKSTQGQSSSSLASKSVPTTPQNSLGGGAGGVAGRQSGPAKPDVAGGPPPSMDTPLTHFRGGAKTVTSFSSGQRTGSGSSGSTHPLAMATGKLDRPEDQSSGQQVSGQSLPVRTKGPVTRSGVRSSSPIPSSVDMPSNSPSERNAKSAEKTQGMSSEEARKLRQAQQRLQREQWLKKYSQAGSTAPLTSTSTTAATCTSAAAAAVMGTVETRSSAGGSAPSADGRTPVEVPQANVEAGVGSDVLISDGKMLSKLKIKVVVYNVQLYQSFSTTTAIENKRMPVYILVNVFMCAYRSL